MLPNFIIGGTSAAGTSFLGSAMIQHPDIYLPFPMEPECHYFFKSWEYEHGEPHYRKKWFSAVNGQKAVGERSSSYLFGGKKVAERIHALLPDVKLIFTLRNPIERAWANYRFTVLQGLEELEFIDALKLEKKRVAAQQGRWAEIQPHNYTGRGMYAKQLSEYLSVFRREQLLVFKSEEMSRHPQDHFARAFQFVGVSSSFEPVAPPNFSSVTVVDPAVQAAARRVLGDKFTPVTLAIRGEEDPYAVIGAGDLALRAAVTAMIGNLTNERRPMDDEARDYLAELYRDENQRLQRLVDFSVDDWR